ncbi:MAG: hypothetical protein P8Z36_07410 [Gemmatimonadota bacterium]
MSMGMVPAAIQLAMSAPMVIRMNTAGSAVDSDSMMARSISFQLYPRRAPMPPATAADASSMLSIRQPMAP